MTSVSVAVLFVFLFGLAAVSTTGQQTRGASENSGSGTKEETPFACDRFAFNAQGRKRHFEELEPKLRSMRTAVRELPNGYEFQFPADPQTIALVAEWAAGERLCCPFFEIELRMEREHGPFWLRLTGRDGTKQFTKEDFRSWM